MIKVLIVEDSELSRNGLLFSFLSQDRFNIVGVAENGEEAITLTQSESPDVVLMDIAMPGIGGIEAMQIIKSNAQNIKVIMLTSHQREEEVYSALAAGADAYCMKDITTERLRQTIELVYDGGFCLDPVIAKLVLHSIRSTLSQSTKSAHSRRRNRVELSEREKEVLKFLIKGKNNKEIADILNISTHTIKAHISSIMLKLSVQDRTQAVIKAINEGLIS